MYRSRLGTDLSDITLDYVSSINDDSEIAMYDILGSQAHSLMLYQNDIITKNDAKKILSALENLKKEKFDLSSGAEGVREGARPRAAARGIPRRAPAAPRRDGGSARSSGGRARRLARAVPG